MLIKCVCLFQLLDQSSLPDSFLLRTWKCSPITAYCLIFYLSDEFRVNFKQILQITKRPDMFLSCSSICGLWTHDGNNPRIKETSQFSRYGKISALVFLNVLILAMFLPKITSFITAFDEILCPRVLTIAFQMRNARKADFNWDVCRCLFRSDVSVRSFSDPANLTHRLCWEQHISILLLLFLHF